MVAAKAVAGREVNTSTNARSIARRRVFIRFIVNILSLLSDIVRRSWTYVGT